MNALTFIGDKTLDFIRNIFPSRSTRRPAKAHENSSFAGAYISALNKRMYAGAVMDRLSGSKGMMSLSADNEVYTSLRVLRNRARALRNDTEYAEKYFSLLKNNIIGKNGFTLQNKARTPDGSFDDVTNQKIEALFADWCKPENCTVTGDMSFRQLCELVLETVACDGEIFVRKVKDPSFKYGLKLQLIAPDYVDESHNETLKNGNIVRMGIEIDNWRRPVAYWVTERDATAELYLGGRFSGTRYRIESREIIHLFNRRRPDQTRGVSWLAPVMNKLDMLAAYEEAAVVAARVGASKMGFFTKDKDNPVGFEGQTKDERGNLIMDVAAGMIEELPGGLKFETFNPDYPHSQYDAFVKAVLRGIASGLGVSYNTLANDLEGVNYSSIRAGLLDERDNYQTKHSWFIENFISCFDQELIKSAVLNGVLKIKITELERLYIPKWIGRVWQWVDQLKDAEAKAKMLSMGWTTNSDIVGELGKDISDIYATLEKEKEMQEKHGLTINPQGNGNQTITQSNPPPDEEGDGTGTPAGTTGGKGRLLKIANI